MSRPGAAEDPALADGHHLARGAAANALVLAAANFRAVFTFLIARLLGEAGLGRFTLVFATVDLISKVGILGLDVAVVPLLVKWEATGDRDGSRRLFVRAVVAGLGVSTLLAMVGLPVLVWIAGRYHLEGFSRGGTIMLLALPGIAVARIATGTSRALMSMRSELYSRGLVETWMTTGVFVIAVGLGLRDTAPSLAVVAGSTGGAIVAFALATRALEAPRRGVARPGPAPSGGALPTMVEMLRFSLPIAGSSLLSSLSLSVDVLLLGAFVGRAPGVTLESFGVFCAAAEVAGGLRKVRQVFDPIFVPVAATRHASGLRGDLRDTVASPGRWVLAGQLPLVGVLVLASGAVLSIYGPGFRSGALWLAVLALAHAANSFTGLVDALLVIERPWLGLINAIVTVSTQLLAGLILIPLYGVIGAVLAMAAGFTLQGVLRFLELRHTFGWAWPWRSLARPLLAFAMAFVPSATLRFAGGQRLEIVSGVLFLLLYGGAWFRLGADPADRHVWKRLLEGESRSCASNRRE